ncbi:sodium/proline symporter [uncultured Anaerotruncus sp.]|uniref:sodium/proline symporter n=1 Tax=uncultured Anaerotruncus sp. TaxID=905011 RepID=UPI00280C24C8|nr:sodium/proline symporter [uncultured Anaerotruncus sp.]
MKWTVLGILIAYFAAMFIIGVAANRKTKNVSDYYVAGRGLGGIIVALVYMSSLVSAGALVGWTGQASSYGVWFIFAGCAVTVATYLCWRLLSGKVMRLSKKLDLMTVPDFLEARFESKKARLISSLILLIFTVPLMVSQFKAAGLLLNMVTGISYQAAVILFGVIVFVYVAFGGYFAVVYTDACQGGLMLFGIIALVVAAMSAIGGNLGAQYAAANPAGAISWPTMASALTPTAFIALLMQNFFGALGAPNYIKGFYSLKSGREQKRGFTIIISIVCVIEVCIIVIGLCGRVLFPDLAAADETVFHMIDTLLPPVVAGLVLSALAAAMMSTMDGLLLMCASTVENDILVHTFKRNLTEKQRMTVARVTVLVIGVVSIVWGLYPPEMLALLMYPAWGILGLSFALAFYGGLYWKRLNASGVCCGMGFGAGSFLLASATGWAPLGLQPIQIGLIFMVAVTLIATYATKPTSSETLERFFPPAAKEG